MIVSYMSIEVVFARVVFMALREGTLERSLARMSRHVSCEILVVDEALPALFTLVRSIRTSSMISLVVSA